MKPLKLQVEDLHKSFLRSGSAFKVLDGINLEVGAGEFVAIIGPSGCGKTTLLNIIGSLVKPDAGRLWLDGQPVPDCQGHIAYMQQKDLLLPWRKVLDNTILGLEVEGVPRKQAYQRAHALLQHFGLAGFQSAYPNQLSGGMRQRVALARTLLLEKPLWLLDEPFGALDAMTRRHLHHYLLQARQQAPATTLLVTHDIEEALVLADRVGVLTARPARIKAILNVELPRPRRVTAPEFVTLKEELFELLQEERLEAMIYDAA
jgi:ABC-type nitrate/sulfonate/bicarbonate transport system ATPase subunit